MDYQKLHDLIEQTPTLWQLPDEDICIVLNHKDQRVLSSEPVFVRVRTLYAHPKFGPERTEQIMAKLNAAAQTSPVCQRVKGWLDSTDDTGGVDVALQATQDALSLFGALGVLDAAEVADLQALGMVIKSSAEVAGLGEVMPGHVEKARALRV